MARTADYYEYLNELAPFTAQEEWDNSGLLAGGMDTEVKGAAVTLDITPEIVERADRLGANLIISHHPVIFGGLKALKKGSAPYLLAEKGINAICCHTPLDMADSGTNDAFADLLGISVYRENDPLLRFAEIDGTTAPALAAMIAEKTGSPVRYADAGKKIKKIALCTGSGCSLMPEALGADAFITGDASHHDFLDALAEGLTLIAAGHYETEIHVVPALCKKLKERFPDVPVYDLGQENPVKITDQQYGA